MCTQYKCAHPLTYTFACNTALCFYGQMLSWPKSWTLVSLNQNIFSHKVGAKCRQAWIYSFIHLFNRSLKKHFHLSRGLLPASLINFCLALSLILEGRSVLGKVTVVPHFLHLLDMAFTVFHSTHNACDIHL